MQFCSVGKFLLRHVKLMPVNFDRLTKQFFHIKQFFHAGEFRDLIYSSNRNKTTSYFKGYLIL